MTEQLVKRKRREKIDSEKRKESMITYGKTSLTKELITSFSS